MNQNRELKRCRNNAQLASPAGADAVKLFTVVKVIYFASLVCGTPVRLILIGSKGVKNIILTRGPVL